MVTEGPLALRTGQLGVGSVELSRMSADKTDVHQAIGQDLSIAQINAALTHHILSQANLPGATEISIGGTHVRLVRIIHVEKPIAD